MFASLQSTSARRLLILLSLAVILFSCIAYFFLTEIIRPPVQTECAAFANNTAINVTRSATNYCQFNLFLLDIAPEIFKGLIASAITSAFFLACWRFMGEHEARLRDVEVLDRPACKARHQEVLRATDFWFHDGHAASWVRRHVLPVFRDRAKGMASFQIVAAIMDPRHEEVCKSYLDHIRHLPAEEQISKTLFDVRAELCTTVLDFLYEYLTCPYVSVRLFLKQNIDYIREDVSSECAFLTIVGSDTPGIVVSKRGDNSTFYNIISTNFQKKRARDAEVDFASCIATVTIDTMLNATNAKQALECLLPGANFITDELIANALERLAVARAEKVV